MTSTRAQALLITLLGLLGLASAMGIGRFAFTPALPLMQARDGLSLMQGSWLASINYAGYLCGALMCIWLPARPALWARAGLLVVALVTLAMAYDAFAFWLLWRLLAGIASAFVLVGLSAWCLGQLARLNRSELAGWIYAGVGLGVALAGLVGMGAGIYGWGASRFWLCLGLVAALVWLLARSRLTQELPETRAQVVGMTTGFNRDQWRLIVCYGIFGLGYILPATFLPAMARDQLGAPALFGWVWPLFGAAAACSTLLVASVAKRFAPRRIWAVASIIMALGVALPVLAQGLAVLLLAALCVGGTFMVMTMAGMQEARAQGGARLIAAMTASFASGQIAGPLLVNLAQGELLWPSLAGVLLLMMGAVALLQSKT